MMCLLLSSLLISTTLAASSSVAAGRVKPHDKPPEEKIDFSELDLVHRTMNGRLAREQTRRQDISRSISAAAAYPNEETNEIAKMMTGFMGDSIIIECNDKTLLGCRMWQSPPEICSDGMVLSGALNFVKDMPLSLTRWYFRDEVPERAIKALQRLPLFPGDFDPSMPFYSNASEEYSIGAWRAGAVVYPELHVLYFSRTDKRWNLTDARAVKCYSDPSIAHPADAPVWYTDVPSNQKFPYLSVNGKQIRRATE